jgi:hypothetical protein
VHHVRDDLMAGPPPKSGGSQPEGSGKESRSRVGEWVQTTQGIVAILTGILTLAVAATSAVYALHHHQPPVSPGLTPSATLTTPNPGLPSSSPAPATSVSASPAMQAQLTQALLPTQALGLAATVQGSGTSLSALIGFCGESLRGAELTAYETLQDGQNGQFLQEAIIKWDNTGDAALVLSNDHAALDKTGGCSYSADGQTTVLTGDLQGSPPPECDNGQYVATQTSVQSESLFGFSSTARCGLYTVFVEILSYRPEAATKQTADGYLNNAAGTLQQTLARR